MNSDFNSANNDPSTVGSRQTGRMGRPTFNLSITVLTFLVLGSANAAHAAQNGPACTLERCNARLDSTAISQAVRNVVSEVVSESGVAAIDKPRGPTSIAPLDTPPTASAIWERRLGAPGARENYNCALSVGLGGALGGDRFLATRALGRTKVWHSE